MTREVRWGTGKTVDFEHQLRRPDGTRVAEVVGVGGLLDLHARKLIPSPGERFRQLATEAGILGL